MFSSESSSECAFSFLAFSALTTKLPSFLSESERCFQALIPHQRCINSLSALVSFFIMSQTVMMLETDLIHHCTFPQTDQLQSVKILFCTLQVLVFWMLELVFWVVVVLVLWSLGVDPIKHCASQLNLHVGLHRMFPAEHGGISSHHTHSNAKWAQLIWHFLVP